MIENLFIDQGIEIIKNNLTGRDLKPRTITYDIVLKDENDEDLFDESG
jgi:hypothetical protein